MLFVTTFPHPSRLSGARGLQREQGSLEIARSNLRCGTGAAQNRVNSIAPGPIATPLWGQSGCRGSLASRGEAVTARLIQEASAPPRISRAPRYFWFPTTRRTSMARRL